MSLWAPNNAGTMQELHLFTSSACSRSLNKHAKTIFGV